MAPTVRFSGAVLLMCSLAVHHHLCIAADDPMDAAVKAQGHQPPKPLSSSTATGSSLRNVAPPSIEGGVPEMVMGVSSGAKPITANCHATTLVSTPGGGVVSAWFGGTKEGNRDVAIYTASRSPEGAWSPARQIFKIMNEPHWNPVLFWFPEPSAEDPAGKLWLHFKVGMKPRNWRTYVSSSTDAGDTWSEAAELVPGDIGGRGCVKNKPLVLPPSGPSEPSPAIIAGASLETGYWRVFFDRSSDGESWEPSKPLQATPAAGLIQPTLWQSSPAGVHAMFRSNAGFVYRSDSSDGGRTWGAAYRTKLPNNNSGLDVARLSDGTLILAFNPVSGDPKTRGKGNRYPLSLAASQDNGETWDITWDVETEPGEYSYPAIVPWPVDAKEGPGFCVTYTWHREDVGFVSMSLEELKSLSASQKPLLRKMSSGLSNATSWGRLTWLVLSALAFVAVFTVVLAAKGFCRTDGPEVSFEQIPQHDSDGMQLRSLPNNYK